MRLPRQVLICVHGHPYLHHKAAACGRAARCTRCETENRNPSDVATEAILWYFSRRKLPIEAATPAELRAIRRGETAFLKGDYVTLDEYFRSVASPPPGPAKKSLARIPSPDRERIEAALRQMSGNPFEGDVKVLSAEPERHSVVV